MNQFSEAEGLACTCSRAAAVAAVRREVHTHAVAARLLFAHGDARGAHGVA